MVPQLVDQMIDGTRHIDLTIEVRVLAEQRQCLSIKNRLDICKSTMARGA